MHVNVKTSALDGETIAENLNLVSRSPKQKESDRSGEIHNNALVWDVSKRVTMLPK